MSSEDGSTKGIVDAITGKFDPTSSPLDYVKRFFYQILGIYFPAAILVLYLLLIWKEPHIFSLTPFEPATNIISPLKNLNSLFEYIKSHDAIIQLLLFIIGIAVVGEAINSITSKLARLSPIKKRYLREKSRKIRLSRLILRIPIFNRILFGQTFPSYDPIKIADWPIWLNITRFPVNFAHFDRYYVSVLEQDKKTLAGKIGWISFYRNMTAISVIILILQSYIVYHFSIVHHKDLFNGYLYEYYILVIAAVSIALFYLGYYAQANAHRSTLWDAYRRNELRKNLETRYGEISLSLGIYNKFKKKTIEYTVDRWFLGVEQSMQSLSSFLVSIVEKVYAKSKEKIEEDNNYSLHSFIAPFSKEKEQEKDPLLVYLKSTTTSATDTLKLNSPKLKEIEPYIRKLLADSYREWYTGGYTQVISDALDALKLFQLSLTPKAWQTIRGQYNLENSLRTDAAFKEVEDNVIEWGWTYRNKKNNDNQSNKKPSKTNSPSADLEKKEDFDNAANIISKSLDPFRNNFDKIMHSIKGFNDMLKREELYHLEKFDATIVDEPNTKGNSALKVNVDGQELKISIDGKILRINRDDDGDGVLKVSVVDGQESEMRIKDKSKIVDIDMSGTLSDIYYLFGAHKYNEAGQKAQKLLGEIKNAETLLRVNRLLESTY